MNCVPDNLLAQSEISVATSGSVCLSDLNAGAAPSDLCVHLGLTGGARQGCLGHAATSSGPSGDPKCSV